MNRYTLVGIGLTLLGGILWGFSGTCVQFLQQNRGISAEWLVTVRMFLAGWITIIGAYVQGRGTIFKIFQNKSDCLLLVVYSLMGMALSQYTYFRAIDYAGVGIATVLQFSAPSLIIVYMIIRYKNLPTWRELLSVVLATLGILVIVFHGDFSAGANIDEMMLFWGLCTATAAAIYSAQAVPILRKYGTGPVVGFSMVLGSMGTFLLWNPIDSGGYWDIWTWGAFLGVIILGTVVSFNAYLEGVRRIGAVRGSILTSIEPISAGVFGWTLLGNEFHGSDYIGFAMILATVFILASDKKGESK